MEIPEFLVTQIREGKAAIFLGAGASCEAATAAGKKAPTTKELAALLANRFLGGGYKECPLNQVAEYAISQSDLATVQTYIKDIFEPLEPTQAHLKICDFAWHGIATTNYDLLVEKAYGQIQKPIQLPRPLIENGDRIEDNLRQPENILLLKLHGCITRIANPKCPLILTTDQYIEYRQGRARLFEVLTTWAYEHSVVFIGSNLQDADIRTILLELTKSTGEFRPRYFVVAPDVDDVKARFWEGRKITAVKGSFDEFMSTLEEVIPKSFRGLALLRSVTTYPIEQKFKTSGAVLSRATAQFLENDVEYVRSLTTTEHIDPRNFYKGLTSGFSAIEQGLDVRRKLGDTVLADYFLRDEQAESDGPEVLLLKAHAGAGKSVLVRRIAWEAAHDYDRICLFLKSNGVLTPSAVQELISLCRQRIFLFVDDAADRVRELHALFREIGPEGKYLTVILSERMNEWNIQAQSIAQFVTEEYELKYLTGEEIESLLELLAANRALGTLEPLDIQQRRTALAERAGRQLLVALHEATLSRPFEEILVDEFKHIEPYEAQRMYLTVCILYRLNVPVRAGIIARIHGIPFEQFKERFFAPLEHVVFAQKDPIIRDYTYRARHPHIAEVVFTRILSNPEERFDSYVRCLKALNVSYSADWKAFWQMVRGRKLLELFPDQSMVRHVFAAAKEIVGEDAHLLHQMAVYEMNRPGGDPHECSKLLSRAAGLAPYDATIKHSMAEQKLRAVDLSKTELEKKTLLKEAADISVSLISSEKTDSYAHHTLVKVGLRKLQDALETNAPDIEIEKFIKEVEQGLSDALQQFPGDPYLLETESQFAAVINDHERAIRALEKAFAANNRNSFIALRLATQYEKQGAPPKARETLEKALAATNGERRLHYAYGKLLMRMNESSSDTLLYHLQRSFTEGDSSYDAQLLYGRQLFIGNDIEGSRKVFKKLSEARVGLEFRNKLLYPVEGQIYRGRVSKLESSYCFIARDGAGDWVYSHLSNVEEMTWKNLMVGTRVEFKIAFSFRGPKAFEVSITK